MIHAHTHTRARSQNIPAVVIENMQTATDDDDDAVTRIWLKHRGDTAGCIGLIVDTRLGATKMFLQDTEVKLLTIEK